MRTKSELLDQFLATRQRTEEICSFLQTEDYVVQPIVDVSPPKWHLGHSTWFFEHFVLTHKKDYRPFDPDYNYLFNSYYESVGERVLRPQRGNLSRPTVQEVYSYRKYVTEQLRRMLTEGDGITQEGLKILQLGIHHEKQHQELLLTDIKYILGHNPLFPKYNDSFEENPQQEWSAAWIGLPEGIFEIGHPSPGSFAFDNEHARHKVYLQSFEISNRLVTNGEYLEFLDSGGYAHPLLWHSQAWEWVQENDISCPMYWHQINGEWHQYSLQGLRKLEPEAPLSHISYYEAFAFAEWKGMRLPTEFEWEAAQSQFQWGSRWEWTESAYLPYPGFTKSSGALGEYNGKFMVNQKVLRGSSIASAPQHIRPTYRNFFHPELRWQFTGIRLAKKQLL